jgi:hypothetical protein
MNNLGFPWNNLVDRYSEKFPDINPFDHYRIIEAASDESGEIAWGYNEFIEWYDEVGELLQKRVDVLEEFLRCPHAVLFNEGKIILGDWEGKTLLDKLKDRTYFVDAPLEDIDANDERSFPNKS